MTIHDAIAVNGQPITMGSAIVSDWYEWQPLEITCAPQPGIIRALLSVNNLALGSPSTTLGDAIWRWHWNPQHAVGSYEATLELSRSDGTQVRETFPLRIVPRKLDRECYEQLLTAIQQDAYAIVYALNGGRQGVVLDRTTSRTLVEEYYTLVEGHVGEALAVVEQIGARPHQQLKATRAAIELGQVEQLDSRALADLAQTPLDIIPDDVVPALQAVLRPPEQGRGGPLPRMVTARKSVVTADIVEHRVLKHVLQVLVGRLGYVRELTRRELQRRQRNAPLVDGPAAVITLKSWLHHCGQKMRLLRQATALPWLAGIGGHVRLHGPTQLMLRDARYRRLYELYQAMRTAPFIAFDSPAMWLPIQDLPTLYEQWCVLHLIKTLLPLGHVERHELIEGVPHGAATHDRLTLRLQHHRPMLELRLPDQTRLAVWYQRRYQPVGGRADMLGSLDPFVRIPDIAIEVVRPAAGPQVLVFDAKYRIGPDGGVPQDALDDAYAYRSAIVLNETRATLGAFLLFPGSQSVTTADQVGALPLVPGQTAALDELVHQNFVTGH